MWPCAQCWGSNSGAREMSSLEDRSEHSPSDTERGYTISSPPNVSKWKFSFHQRCREASGRFYYTFVKQVTWSVGAQSFQETPLQWKSWLVLWLKCKSPISSGTQGLVTELLAVACGSHGIHLVLLQPRAQHANKDAERFWQTANCPWKSSRPLLCPQKRTAVFVLTFSWAGPVLWDADSFLRGSDFTAGARCCAPLLTTRMFAFLPFLDGDVSSSTFICMIPWYWR